MISSTNMHPMGLMFIVLHISYGYENIALYKPTFQSHVYVSQFLSEATYDSSNAVDGRKTDLSARGGQCAISADTYNAVFWWVNLTSIHSIHDIRIYYRTDNIPWGSRNGYTARFLGFYLYISNTTNTLKDGHLCFHDTNNTRATIPAVIDIQCPVHGQYVIYANRRPQMSPYSYEYSVDAHIDLCEVEVFGCKERGYYGTDCNMPCPLNCKHPFCHIKTGACHECKPGYQGSKCEIQCENRTYGEKCMFSCGACLGKKQCHHFNGICIEGCDSGFEGRLCKTVCPDGKFGINCEQNCNANCGVPYQCNRTTGECEGGCQPGWEGPRCEQVCKGNKYGRNCNSSCGFCWQSVCHHVNGSCTGGCEEGYQGTNCNEECNAGLYGDKCKMKCSLFCKSSSDCHHTTGKCNKGCIGGWQGPLCLEVADRKDDLQAEFYGVLAALCVSLTIVIGLVIYMCIKRQRDNRKFKKQMFKENSKTNAGGVELSIISGKTEEDDSRYQELGELALPSEYEGLK